MKRQKRFLYLEAKNAAAAFSILSLFVAVLVINNSFSDKIRPIYVVSGDGGQDASQLAKLNRAIASAEPMNPFRDVEWERKLADKLKADERTPASVGKAASVIDDLRFGLLAGKYRFVDISVSQREPQEIKAHTASNSTESLIKEIHYADSVEANDRPVFVEPEEILNKYGSVFAIAFSSFDRSNPQQNTVREYRLLDGQKKQVGLAAFTMDEEGRFLSLKLSSSEVH